MRHNSHEDDGSCDDSPSFRSPSKNLSPIISGVAVSVTKPNVPPSMRSVYFQSLWAITRKISVTRKFSTVVCGFPADLAAVGSLELHLRLPNLLRTKHQSANGAAECARTTRRNKRTAAAFALRAAALDRVASPMNPRRRTMAASCAEVPEASAALTTPPRR